MTVMIDTPAVGIVWHLMPCPSGYLIEWQRPDGTWCYVNSEGSCYRYDADGVCWISDGVPDDTDKAACYGRLVPIPRVLADANPYSRGPVVPYKIGRVGDLLPCAEGHFVEWQRSRNGGWYSAGPGIRFAPDEYDRSCLGRVVPRTEAGMSAHKRGPVTVRVPAPPEHPTFEAARVGALLSRELPPGSWVEWVETVDGEEVWYSAGNEGTPRLWYRRRWMEVGSEHLLRWVRSIGRLVTAGSDPDPTSRGPITGGGS